MALNKIVMKLYYYLQLNYNYFFYKKKQSLISITEVFFLINVFNNYCII